MHTSMQGQSACRALSCPIWHVLQAMVMRKFGLVFCISGFFEKRIMALTLAAIHMGDLSILCRDYTTEVVKSTELQNTQK